MEVEVEAPKEPEPESSDEEPERANTPIPFGRRGSVKDQGAALLRKVNPSTMTTEEANAVLAEATDDFAFEHVEPVLSEFYHGPLTGQYITNDNNGAKYRDLRCVLRPSTEGAGCKTRLESKTNHF